MTRCRCVGTRHTCGIQNVSPNVVVVGQGGPKGTQGIQGVQGVQGSAIQGTQGTIGPVGPGAGAQGTQGTQGLDGGGVTLQQLTDAIAGVALGSTDDLSEGVINKYFTPGRVSYQHTQGVASNTWNITHNLQFYPNVTIQDSAGNIVEGEISYTNSDSLVVTFSTAFSGEAYLS